MKFFGICGKSSDEYSTTVRVLGYVPSDASMDAFAGGAEPEPKAIPRRFWFDRPFFLFLWRAAAAWPYAGVWLGSAEALAK